VVRQPNRAPGECWQPFKRLLERRSLQDLVRKADLACIEAEQDRELSAGGIARRRAELCDQVLRKRRNFEPFEIAERALTENVNALERLSDRNPEQVQMLQRLKQALTDP
jgi:hypothetical protein